MKTSSMTTLMRIDRAGAAGCSQLGVSLAAVTVALGIVAGLKADSQSFAREIRPILATKCFPCHGPDEKARKADLRLDDNAKLLAEGSGGPIVVPGQPDQSELFRRITSPDAAERMPPADSIHQLTGAEVATIRAWISGGAAVETHWAFVAPKPSSIPNVTDRDWMANPIDAFVLARLERERKTPSPRADRTSLIRRLTLDLTGLPPTPEEVDAFLQDDRPGATERLIDRLLASPRFGERMALDWLDVARFADSGGYQGDIFRTMWPWRDWVIDAYNRNLPFDQFTIDQLAGDLLPNATREQQIASGFNRNHRINDEDGIVHEEFRVEYVADRVDTTATAWLGLTLACARCHDHKYDPISQREYYEFFAYFNSIDEDGRGYGNAPPVLRLSSAEQEREAAVIDATLDGLRAILAAAGDASAESKSKVLEDAIAAAQKRREAVLATAPVTMVMRELASPRKTFVLMRGAYDRPGAEVGPGTPDALPAISAESQPNRLALANWLVRPDHPLVARVFVNRLWQSLFGFGLVRTPEDFGVQGSPPTHPELLDWLALEMIRCQWNVKRMFRLVAGSAAYQQSSQCSAAEYAADPENRLLARGPRFRLSAEALRDQALSASGLLVDRLGGAPVRPYQPDGIWKELASAHLDYEQSHGAELYRRSLYTFWRRTIPPPSMTALDAPNRETCSVRRPRTNTPIQSLVLMNDPIFVEAARHLALRTWREAEPKPAARLERAFRLVLARPPRPRESTLLTVTFDEALNRYRGDDEAVSLLLQRGESRTPNAVPKTELAAMTTVAMAILNLDEAVTKE